MTGTDMSLSAVLLKHHEDARTLALASAADFLLDHGTSVHVGTKRRMVFRSGLEFSRDEFIHPNILPRVGSLYRGVLTRTAARIVDGNIVHLSIPAHILLWYAASEHTDVLWTAKNLLEPLWSDKEAAAILWACDGTIGTREANELVCGRQDFSMLDAWIDLLSGKYKPSWDEHHALGTLSFLLQNPTATHILRKPEKELRCPTCRCSSAVPEALQVYRSLPSPPRLDQERGRSMKTLFPGSALSHGQYHIMLEEGGESARCAILAVMFLKKRAYARAERVVAERNEPNINMIRFGLGSLFGDKYTPTDEELTAWLAPINVKPWAPRAKKIRPSRVNPTAALPGRTRRPVAGSASYASSSRPATVRCGTSSARQTLVRDQ